MLTDSYHNSEDVTMHGLVVQALSGVQSACSRVQPELPQAEGIGAAQERVGQFVFLVFVHSTNLQDFRPCRLVFRNAYNVNLMGELRAVVVGVNDANKHLKEKIHRILFKINCFSLHSHK